MTSSPNVSSEIGTLRTVLVHRPDVEIAHITPDNKADLLFDDLLWLERAQEEHDAFAQLMTDRGVEVLYFRDLLTETLAQTEVKNDLLSSVFTPEQCGPSVAAGLTAALTDVSASELVDILMGGMRETDLATYGIAPLFEDLVTERFRYVLRPLPNLLFMRDNAAWINNGVALNVLAKPARSRESLYMRAIYRHHPRFADIEFPVWFGDDLGDGYPATLEGGDILVLNERTVMIGAGERTAPAAVEMLARRLFRGSVERVIVVHLRRDRSVMHLDTVFTMIDHATFNVFPRLLESVNVYTIAPGADGSVSVEHGHDLLSALKTALGLESLTIIPTGGDEIGRLREQWDDGNNTLALEPGVVIAYQRNTLTNRRLVDAGIEVLELDASELCRGRGGSRCMTQPIVRDPV